MTLAVQASLPQIMNLSSKVLPQKAKIPLHFRPANEFHLPDCLIAITGAEVFAEDPTPSQQLAPFPAEGKNRQLLACSPLPPPCLPF